MPGGKPRSKTPQAAELKPDSPPAAEGPPGPAGSAPADAAAPLSGTEAAAGALNDAAADQAPTRAPAAAEAALQEVAASAQQWPEQLKQLMDVVMGRTVPEAAVLLVEVDAAGKGTEQTLRDVS